MEELDASQESAQVVENSVPDEENQTTENNQQESEDGLLPESEEDDEIDVDGKKFSMPKSVAEKLKSERLMHADYTRKTQEVAEQRKQIQQERESVQHQARVQQEFINEIAEVHAIDKQLAQFNQLDWQAVIDNDPVQALKLQHQLQALQQQREKSVSNITQKQQEAQWNEQQTIAKSVQEGQSVLTRDIKGWSPELASKLMSYGEEVGFQKDRLRNISDPSVVKLLHKAYLYDQLVKTKSLSSAPAEKTPAPVTRLKASAPTGIKDPAKMNDREFSDWRRSQIKNRK